MTVNTSRLYVEDADAVYQQALSAGAIAVTEMTSLSWGIEVVVCAIHLATSGGFRAASSMSIKRRWQSAPQKSSISMPGAIPGSRLIAR